MANITIAQAKKNELSLNKLFRYPEGVMSRKEWLTLKKKSGYSTEITTKNKVEYNRIKYNRMNGHEQAEYEKKCNEKVVSYRLNNPTDSSFYEITKSEHDYFNTL